MRTTSLLVVALATSWGYCLTGGNTFKGDSNMGAVTLNDLQHDVNNCDSQGVEDYTAAHATLKPGAGYTLTILATTCGNPYPRKIAAYIDFGGTGDYAGAEDKLGEQDVDGPGIIPVTLQFQVPSSAKSGTESRMRVVLMELPGPDMDPCTPFNYGNSKEFKIKFDNSAKTEGGGGGLSDGSIFLILFFVFGFLYIAGGMVYGIKKQGKQGMEAFPHRELWFSTLPGLVRDGCSFTRSKIMELKNGSGSTGDAAYNNL